MDKLFGQPAALPPARSSVSRRHTTPGYAHGDPRSEYFFFVSLRVFQIRDAEVEA